MIFFGSGQFSDPGCGFVRKEDALFECCGSVMIFSYPESFQIPDADSYESKMLFLSVVDP
jgi:hypothetical protein